MNKDKLVYVAAPNYHIAQRWARKQELRTTGWRYLAALPDVMGLKDAQVAVISTPGLVPNSRIMHHLLQLSAAGDVTLIYDKAK